jgi:CheY-like chemotaxis protein
MRILVVDDSKERQKIFTRGLIGNEQVIQAFNYDQAIEALNTNIFDLIFLDHDLDEEAASKSGMEVARYMVEMEEDRRPKKAIIHSLNPSGVENIASVLRGIGMEMEKISFLKLKEAWE